MSGAPDSNPYAQFVKPKPDENPYAQFAKPQGPQVNDDLAHRIGAAVIEQPGLGALEMAAKAPGIIPDVIVGGGNFLRRQFGIPETPLAQTPLAGYGMEDWYKWAQKPIAEGGLNVPAGPAPQNEAERLGRKAGGFVVGALPFGLAAAVPAVTAAGGSEVGRALDQAAPQFTHGYGETVGAFAGGVLPDAYAMATEVAPTVGRTNDQIRSLANDAYQRADDAGVIIKPQAMVDLRDNVVNELTNAGYDPALNPGIKAVLDRLDQATSQPITLKGLDIIRRVAGNAAGNIDRSTAKMGGKIIKNIDQAATKLKPEDVLTGDATAGVKALTEARGLWSQLSKSELVDTQLGKAARQAARTGSGGGIENAIRQKISAILDSPSKVRGFTADERALMQRVVDGSGGLHETFRLLGKLSPQGNGLAMILEGGSYLGTTNPLTLIPPALGLISKPISEAMTRSNAADLSNAVRGVRAAPRRMVSMGVPARRLVSQAMPVIPGALATQQ